MTFSGNAGRRRFHGGVEVDVADVDAVAQETRHDRAVVAERLNLRASGFKAELVGHVVGIERRRIGRANRPLFGATATATAAVLVGTAARGHQTRSQGSRNHQ